MPAGASGGVNTMGDEARRVRSIIDEARKQWAPVWNLIEGRDNHVKIMRVAECAFALVCSVLKLPVTPLCDLPAYFSLLVARLCSN